MPSEQDIKRIVNYLKQETAVGYDISTLRNYLLSQGYGQELVDSAIDVFYGKTHGKGFRLLEYIKNISPKQKKILFFSTLAILIIGMTFLALIYFIDGKDGRKTTGSDLSKEIIVEERPVIDTDLFVEKIPEVEVAEVVKEELPIVSETKEEITVEKIRETTLKEELRTIEDLDDSLKFCEKEEVDKDECYSAVAEKFENAEICIKINKQLKKETCIIALSYSSDGYKYCGEIENPTTQRLCRNIGRNQERGETALLSSEDIIIKEANEEEINESELIVYIVDDEEFNVSWSNRD